MSWQHSLVLAWASLLVLIARLLKLQLVNAARQADSVTSGRPVFAPASLLCKCFASEVWRFVRVNARAIAPSYSQHMNGCMCSVTANGKSYNIICTIDLASKLHQLYCSRHTPTSWVFCASPSRWRQVLHYVTKNLEGSKPGVIICYQTDKTLGSKQKAETGAENVITGLKQKVSQTFKVSLKWFRPLYLITHCKLCSIQASSICVQAEFTVRAPTKAY